MKWGALVEKIESYNLITILSIKASLFKNIEKHKIVTLEWPPYSADRS